MNSVGQEVVYKKIIKCKICCSEELLFVSDRAGKCLCNDFGEDCDEDSCLNRGMKFECFKRCSNGKTCKNRRFQTRKYASVQIFNTKDKGYGMKATKCIQKGEFIIEYIGDIIDGYQLRKRLKRYERDPKQNHYYIMSLDSNTYIDATKRGNEARFVNHSCDPNAETQKWTVDRRTRIGFFATRDIEVDEEIAFDYKFVRFGKTAQKCLCRSKNCRGVIGLQSKIECTLPDEDISSQSESEFSEEDSDEELVFDPCKVKKRPRKVKVVKESESEESDDEELVDLSSIEVEATLLSDIIHKKLKDRLDAKNPAKAENSRKRHSSFLQHERVKAPKPDFVDGFDSLRVKLETATGDSQTTPVECLLSQDNESEPVFKKSSAKPLVDPSLWLNTSQKASTLPIFPHREQQSTQYPLFKGYYAVSGTEQQSTHYPLFEGYYAAPESARQWEQLDKNELQEIADLSRQTSTNYYTLLV